jgi:uncharacterized protein (TIGR02466 family)
MSLCSLFHTLLYDASLGADADLDGLEQSCLALARDDHAGRRWCKDNAYPGYTSYASLDDLPARDPRFAALVRLINRHATRFGTDCGFDLKRRPKLDSLWVNVLKANSGHAAHIHPHSVLSGTFYVAMPAGSGSLRIEDPRLGLMMAAPPRLPDAPEPLRTFVTIQPVPGTLLLWESWLRHEVMPGTGKGERISISFNYRT